MKNFTQAKNSSPFDAAFIQKLKALLQAAKVTGSKALDEKKLNSYWQMGLEMAHIKNAGPLLLKDLAVQIEAPYSLVQRCRQFYETWQDGVPTNTAGLSWSHHIHLMRIGDKKVRQFYIKETLKNGWDRDSLSRAIKNHIYDKAQNGTYVPDIKPKIDGRLNIYKAYLDQILDGDTVRVRLDLGFGVTVSQLLRLKGVNASELNKNAIDKNNTAELARQFVIDKLTPCPFLVIKTHKSDIYGRYLAEVYYHPDLTHKEDVVKKGFCLNQQLLDAGLAVPMLV